LRSGIEVIQMREDFSVFLGRLDHVFDPVHLVGIVNRGAINNGILAVAVVVDG